MTLTYYRGSILHFHSDPDSTSEEESSFTFCEDGLLVVETTNEKDTGTIDSVIPDAAAWLSDKDASQIQVVDYSGHLILPGMIDTHIHFPQVEIMASFGEQLLDWLNNYTFPAEGQYGDLQYAKEQADFFLKELLKNGTTTALVFGTVHPQSVQAFFEASHAKNARMICGKVLMDRNAPDFLCDKSPQCSYDESKALIQQWHQKGRQLYAITPRFAITSTPEQLQMTQKLKEEFPTTYVQSHISENPDEVAFVKELFPDRMDYLDVYDHYNLLGPNTVLAHGIHLTPREHQRLRETQTSISFCPTSNLFLGSGLLDLHTLQKEKVRYSVATDVGGGTSLSMLQTLSEAYKVGQLKGTGKPLSPLKSLYMATLGNAQSLQLEDKIGNFDQGKEADFCVLDFKGTPLLAHRQSRCKTLREKLFAMIVLGDDRAVKATYVGGRLVHERDGC